MPANANAKPVNAIGLENSGIEEGATTLKDVSGLDGAKSSMPSKVEF
jgi:hypothetical protein